jgi:hypothetical protein
MILSGSLIQKLFSKDGIRVTIGKSILQSPTVIWNCSLNYYFKYQIVILCLIYHRSFGGVVDIYDSNWYIKRLNNIEIDKNKMRYFGPLSHNFRPRRRGCFARTDTPPLHRGLNRLSPYHCLICFKPLVTALTQWNKNKMWFRQCSVLPLPARDLIFVFNFQKGNSK